MPVKTKVKWGNVHVSEDLLRLVDEYIQGEKSKRLDLHSRTDVASEAIKRLLKSEGLL
ncbi:MAG: hypothetical protein ABSF09_07705 [Candidatus Bathyarchaeia archaeon]